MASKLYFVHAVECCHSSKNLCSPKYWVLPTIQALTLELWQDRLRKGLTDSINASKRYIACCQLEVDDLANGSSDEEPEECAQHRANLAEFLRNEIDQASQYIVADRQRQEGLLCSAVLPVLESFPKLPSPIRWAPERVTFYGRPSSGQVCAQLCVLLKYMC
jgi:hypothetical protein